MVIGLGFPLGPAGRPAMAYLLRDVFGVAQHPAVSGAVDGGSQVTTGTRLKQLDGALRGGSQATSPTWGASERRYSGIPRAVGRSLAMLVLPSDSASDLAAGLATVNSAGDPRADGYGLVLEDGQLQVMQPGQKVTIAPGLRNLKPIEYLLVVAMNDVGAYVLLSTFAPSQSFEMDGPLVIPQFPAARVVWASRSGAAATLYPLLSFYDEVGGYTNGHLVDDVRVLDVPSWASADFLAAFSDRFTRTDSASALGNGWTAVNGVFGLVSGQAYMVSGAGFLLVQRDTGIADGIYEWDVVVPAGTLPFFGGVLRYQDSANYIRWVNNAGNQLEIQSWVGGKYGSAIFSAPFTWAPSTMYRVSIFAIGNKYAVFMTNLGTGAVEALNGGYYSTDGDNRFLSATSMGLLAANVSGIKWDNVSATPHQVTLPPWLQNGAGPTVRLAGTVLASDDFMDANGVRLTVHGAGVGGAWTEHLGVWTIQSGRAACASVVGINIATQELATRQVQAEVEVRTPAVYSTGIVRAGIVIGWVDANRYLAVRLFRDTPSQPASDEIEIVEVLEGSVQIQRKVNIGNALSADAAYRLRVQHITDDARYPRGLVQVLVWNGAVWTAQLSHPCSVAFMGTQHGLYLEHIDEGCVVESWLVQTV